jgi:hypothetical protein
VSDTLTGRLYHTGRFVAQQERVLIVDATLAIGQIGMTERAGDHLDHHLARPRIGNDDVDQLDGRPLPLGDDAAHCLTHVLANLPEVL